MEQAVFTLRVNQQVNTPNGPGIVQGRMIEDGETIILVSHNPKDVRVSESIRNEFITGIWILRRYALSQIMPTTNGK